MPTKPKPDLRLLIKVEDTNSFGDAYLTVTATVGVMIHGDGVCHPQFGSYREHGGDEYDAFQVRSQLDRTSGTFYGRALEFSQPFAVKLDRAKSMAALLGRLERRMTALNGRFGYAIELHSFLGRVAEAIGAPETRCFGRRSPDSCDGTGFQWMDVEGLRWYLDDEVKKWRERHGITVAAA